MQGSIVDTSSDLPSELSTRVRFRVRGCLAAAPAQTMAADERKRTQRERLLNGMVEATNRRGYAGANVTAVIGEARVSRPTFYDYFTDRDACFRAAIEDAQEHAIATALEAIARAEPRESLAAAVEAIVSHAVEQPARARFLMGESMAGGASALTVRDRGLARVAAAIERRQRAAPVGASMPDVDPRVALGTVYRMIAARLRRGEVPREQFAEELRGWLSAYERPARSSRWRKLAPLAAAARSLHLPDGLLRQMPPPLTPGRPSMSESQIAENHRLRILCATAMLAQRKGYAATTVADIMQLASVGGRVFYRHFANKHDAFQALHEHGFQQLMDVTASAFFAENGWPRRSWEAGRALTQFLEENPLIAHVGFVEAYAIGPSAVQRVEDSHVAFMFFLQEGLAQATPERMPSRVTMEAVIASVFEVIYLCVRGSGRPRLSGMLGPIAHLWLSPFLGVEEADAFIDEQLRRERTETDQETSPSLARRSRRR